MNILLFNFFLYAFWWVVTYYRERKITIYSVLVLLYTIVAFLGYLTVYNGVYFDVFGYKSVKKLQLDPYLYALVSYILLFWPLKNIKLDYRNLDVVFSKGVSIFIRFWIVYFTLFTFLKLFEASASLALGLGEVYDARHNEGEQLFAYDNILLNKFNGYGYFLLNATVPLIMSYVFIALKKGRISHSYAMFLILLCFFPSILNAIAMGSRGGLFMTAFCFVFFISLFWNSIPKPFLYKVYIHAVLFVTLTIFYSWLITSDRVGTSNEGLNSILRYFGESFPNLGFNFWGEVQHHPMGSRLFPNFFMVNETRFYTSTDESYQYWEFKTGVPVLNFKTYFGDLYIEFGTFYSLLFVIACSVLVKKYFDLKRVTVFNMSFLYYYYQLCVFAFAGFTKGGHYATFQLIIIIIVSLILKYLVKIRVSA